MSEIPQFRLRPEIQRVIARMNRSQNHVARECELTSGYLSQLLTGKRHPGPDVRARLLDHLAPLGFDDLFEEVA